MSHSNHINHAGHMLHKAVEEMEPLPEEKNPLIAGLLGFCFGAVGVGLYFRSWKDFLVCLAVLLPLACTGVGILVAAGFAAAYGAFRAMKSNEKREAMAKARETQSAADGDESTLSAQTRPTTSEDVRPLLPAQSHESGPMTAQGFLERAHETAEGVLLSGWVLLEDGAADSIALVVDGQSLIVERIRRDDIAASFPTHPNSGLAGYSVYVPSHVLRRDAIQELRLVARRGNNEVFHYGLLRRPGATGASSAVVPRPMVGEALYI